MISLINKQTTKNIECFQYKTEKTVGGSTYCVDVKSYYVRDENDKVAPFALSGRLAVICEDVLQMDCTFQDLEDFSSIINNYTNDVDPTELWDELVEQVLEETLGF